MRNKLLYDDEVKKNRNRISDYTGAILGLHSFALSAIWDEANRRLYKNAKTSIPSRMKRLSDNSDCTPDGIVQINDSYGVVFDMKKHHSSGDFEPFEQIKKYDEDLIEWWTNSKKIKSHDLVLIVHHNSSVDSHDTFTQWTNQSNKFIKPFAIVSYDISKDTDKGNEYLKLQKICGDISDPSHNEKLRIIKNIDINLAPMKDIISNGKFYDAEPPLIHTLVLLHDYIFPSLVSSDKYETNKRVTKFDLEASLKQLRDELQQRFFIENAHSHKFSLPELSWVEAAVEILVKLKLAFKIDKKKKRYKFILQKPSTDDSIQYFTRLIENLNKQKKGARKTELPQGDLFDTDIKN